jgi:D-alanine-D-alanine ligase and related ATP-grasp enzymes
MKQLRRIGILMGGFSSEREISLKSGTAVAAALRSSGYEVETVDFHSREELRAKLEHIAVDCIFNALHGRFGEDGEVQQMLDALRIPYTGSGAEASRLAMDKVASRRIFQSRGLRVPEYQLFNKNMVMDQMFFSAFPLVVKPAHEGSSIGLSIVHDALSLLWAVEYAFRFDPVVMVEKYVRGREITVGIIDDKPLPVVEVIPKKPFYDFQAKYTAGMTEYRVPADFPRKLPKKPRPRPYRPTGP